MATVVNLAGFTAVVNMAGSAAASGSKTGPAMLLTVLHAEVLAGACEAGSGGSKATRGVKRWGPWWGYTAPGTCHNHAMS